MPRGLAMFDKHGSLRRELETAPGVAVDLLPTPDERMCASRSQKRFAREVQRQRRNICERTKEREAKKSPCE